MKKMLVAGVAIWLGASIALRLAGQYLLDTSAIGIAALAILSAPVMFLLPRRLFGAYGIQPEAFGRAVVALVVPGMLLDAVAATWFQVAYPNMRADAAGVFGGWLLFCNAMALVGAITAPGSPQTRRIP